LDGATAIALPTKVGQRMLVRPTRGSDLIWKSYDMNEEIWFEANISLYDFKAIRTTDESKMPFITKLLKNAVRLNSEFLDKWNGYKIEHFLEYPAEWGLGSSSSLIHNLATWADINPFFLHFKISNGSGYDIACAGADGPIKYINTEEELSYTRVDFDPSFKDQLYFVFLEQKEDSSLAVETYIKEVKKRKEIVKEIEPISQGIIACKKADEFKKLIEEHENIISKAIGKEKVKDLHFSDFPGSVKSLGAWGGDMVLAMSDIGEAEVKSYFSGKGFNTVHTYKDLIL